MRWLTAGLTFVNVATVCSLLLGMLGRGLTRPLALIALVVALLFAILAHRVTNAYPSKPPRPARPWLWLLAAVFAFFAFRSFCWLLYIDGNQLKVQSPNNLGDLSLHLTYIRNFASGAPLWPDNPIQFSSKMRYPGGTDLFNATLLLAGLDLTKGLVWAGLLGVLATFFALYQWGGSFTVAAFLFNGGLAGFKVFQRWKFLDYQGDSSIAWKSLPLAMLVTQRGLLYAFPAGLLLLCHWRGQLGREQERRPLLPFWLEVSLYASMPLFHLHTFMALSLVALCLFAFGNRQRRKHLALVVGVSVIPASFFVWTVTDQFRAKSLLQWHPGWVQTVGDFAAPFFSFWLLNFGLLMPLVLVLVGVCLWQRRQNNPETSSDLSLAVAFLTPAGLLFLFACLVKTAPWEWDNIKLIVWAYLIMLPFLWRQLLAHWPLPVQIAVCFSLFASGFVSLIGGLIAKPNGFTIAERGEVDGVGGAVSKLPATARFAAYPTYNHPLLLQGRKVALGYPGHLWTQGFSYTQDEQRLNHLMLGAPGWREDAKYLGVRYLFWGREETANYPASQHPWQREHAPIASGNWGAIYDLGSTPGL